MAKSLSKTGITTGNTVKAGHVTQSIDAFTGVEAYDLTLSGSLVITGSITGQPGVVNQLTASYALSASVEITHEVSSSYAQTASIAGNLFGNPSIAVTNITASGNISASGDILADKYKLQGTSIIFKRGSDNVLGNSSQPTEIEGSHIELLNPVTASSNISSSGTITGLTGSFSHLVGNSPITVGSPMNFLFPITASNIGGSTIDTGSLGNTTITGSLTVSGSGTLTNIGPFNQTGDSTFTGNITASNNVSASGYLYANQYYVDNNQAISYNSGYRFGFANDLPIQIGKANNPITLMGNITASGNVIASGNISASSFSNIIIATNTNNALEIQDTEGTSYVQLSKFGQLNLGGATAATAGHITSSGNFHLTTGFISQSGTLTFAGLGENIFGANIVLDNNKSIKIGSQNIATFDGSGAFKLAPTHAFPIEVGRSDSSLVTLKGQVTASGNISSSGTVTGVTGSFSHLVGNSPITINDQTTFTLPITASGGFSGEVTNVYRPITTLSTNPFTASNATAGTYYRAGGNITCSIFSSSLVSCTLGSEFEIIQTSSAGYVLFETGSGVTLNSKSGNLKLAGQFSAATLKKVGDNEWDLIGDLG